MPKRINGSLDHLLAIFTARATSHRLATCSSNLLYNRRRVSEIVDENRGAEFCKCKGIAATKPMGVSFCALFLSLRSSMLPLTYPEAAPVIIATLPSNLVLLPRELMGRARFAGSTVLNSVGPSGEVFSEKSTT